MKPTSAPRPAARLFLLLGRAWWTQARRHAAETARRSRLMTGVIGGFVVAYWVGFTWLFCEGLGFLAGSVPGLGDLLVARMLYLLFAFVFGMLLLSSGVVGYGVFFRNRETQWLQTLPIADGALFPWKFLEASLVAAWAFLFLSGPVLLGYALAFRLPWWFLPLAGALYLPFSALASSLGVAGVLALVRLWHSRRGRLALAGALAVGAAAAAKGFRPIDVAALREAEILPLMNLLLENTRAAVSPFLPSYWLTSAILGLGDGLWAKAGFFFAILAAYGAFAAWLVARYLPPAFRDGGSRVQDRRLHARRALPPGWTSPLCRSGRAAAALLRWVPAPARAVVWKDWVSFWRDPAQWGQFAVFFGLLGFYFANLHNFRYQLDDRFWVSVVAFLNLASLALILATMTTRFVFPQFSLEGRRLWLVGLAPTSLKQVVWAKFWASALGAGALTLLLMLLSFRSLALEAPLRWAIGFSVVMMSLGLSGIAVGTGVLFPSFKQANAAQIVSGFGGTLCLVLSLAYVALLVSAVAIPMHWRSMAGLTLDFRWSWGVRLIYMLVAATSAAAALVPMRLAGRRLEHLET